jgi:hypothetical protein
MGTSIKNQPQPLERPDAGDHLPQLVPSVPAKQSVGDPQLEDERGRLVLCSSRWSIREVGPIAAPE